MVEPLNPEPSENPVIDPDPVAVQEKVDPPSVEANSISVASSLQMVGVLFVVVRTTCTGFTGSETQGPSPQAFTPLT